MFEKIEAICGKAAAEELRKLRADVDSLLSGGKGISTKPPKEKIDTTSKKTETQE